MPRGGKRKGAGRKPKLEPMVRQWVGMHCERLWREAYEANLSEAIDEATENAQNEHRRLGSGTNYSDFLESADGQGYEEDIEDALDLDKEYWDRLTLARSVSMDGKLLHVEAKRPKDIRAQIINTVAEEKGISPRMVESCWKEFRQFQKEDNS